MSLRPILAFALVAAAGLVAGSAASAQTPTPSALKIVVIEGEGAVNVIQRKTAVAPVIEVRDRNNLPVIGATVTVTVNGGSAAFAGGANTITIATNAAGRAVVSGLTPLQSGAVQLNLQAAFQGQTAVATITQTNVLTAAQASAAGSAGAASGGGGGMSGTAVAGVVGAAGAAAAGVAVAAGGKEDAAAPAPSIGVSPGGSGLRDVTEFVFSATGATGEVTWEFGDGAAATGSSTSHIFRSAGTFQVTMRAGSSSSTRSVTVGTLTGRWIQGQSATTSSFEDVVMTQDGNRLVGQWSHTCTGLPPPTGVSPCVQTEVSSMDGTITAPRSVSFSHSGLCQFAFTNATVSDDLATIDGTFEIRNPGCVAPVSQQSFRTTFRRQ